uniref:hypothetical protein n=1 Tax=uncultured Allobacillus sp. TaxID=1638025 RepID=UPI00259400E5|nr:hypothetical protein [uncultured Allobacillus sp.]
MGLPKERSFFGGGIVQLFSDLVTEFSGEMLTEILDKYNKGYSFDEIAEYTGRDPDEVFLAIFHMARQGYEVRKIRGVRL